MAKNKIEAINQKLNNLEYWDKFQVKELEFAPEYDGHKPFDIARLYSIL